MGVAQWQSFRLLTGWTQVRALSPFSTIEVAQR